MCRGLAYTFKDFASCNWRCQMQVAFSAQEAVVTLSANEISERSSSGDSGGALQILLLHSCAAGSAVRRDWNDGVEMTRASADGLWKTSWAQQCFKVLCGCVIALNFFVLCVLRVCRYICMITVMMWCDVMRCVGYQLYKSKPIM